MKTLSAIVAALVVMGSVTEASAVVCARGVYRAGCAGPHGAVVTHRPYVHPYVAPAYRPHGCVWRNGVRVCR